MDRFSRRQVKVTREHNEECRRLLGLMGIPFVVVRYPLGSHVRILKPFHSRHLLKQKLNVLSLREVARSVRLTMTR